MRGRTTPAWEAHHIVDFHRGEAQLGREALEYWGISKNSPANSVWLPWNQMDAEMVMEQYNLENAPVPHRVTLQATVYTSTSDQIVAASEAAKDAFHASVPIGPMSYADFIAGQRFVAGELEAIANALLSGRVP